jgi:hypothetical protein
MGRKSWDVATLSRRIIFLDRNTSADIKFHHCLERVPVQARFPRTILIQHYASYLTPLSAVQPTTTKWLSSKLDYTIISKKHFKAPQCKLNKHFNVIKAIVSFHSHGHKVSMLAVTKWRPDTGIANPKVCTMKAHGHSWQKLKKASQITMSKQFPKPYPMSVLTWSINNHPNVIEIQVTQPLRYHNS